MSTLEIYSKDIPKLNLGRSLPLHIQATADCPKLNDFVVAQQAWIETQLLNHGALLFRGFHSQGVAEFEQAMQSLWGELLTYQDRATPRRQVTGRIYTSTEYPPSHQIFLHNENSFAYCWPSRICFFCTTPALEGGATPIADVRRVLQRIEPDIRDRFVDKQVLYVRNFGQGFGLPWETVFNTADRNELEAYCQAANIDVEWLEHGDHLRTRQVRPAIAQHPQTGEWVWFNHAAVLHVSTLKSSIQKAILEEFAPGDLPNNTYYGDGSEIEAEVLEHIRAAYEAEKTIFQWQAGDLLMLDNLLVAHGREPYIGPRTVWVGMARPITWAEVECIHGRFPTQQTLEQSIGPESRPSEQVDRPNPNHAQQPTALETVLAAIWATHLRLEQVDIHDNFFELGGQSLEAIDIIGEIRDIFQVSLSLRALTITPTVSELASSLIKTPAEQLRIEEIARLTLEMLQDEPQEAETTST